MLNCASAPHMKITVVSPPTSASETSPPSRSSTIFGNATVEMWNTRPALSEITTNSAKMAAPTQGASATSGVDVRLAP